jgi:hypothetical protein
MRLPGGLAHYFAAHRQVWHVLDLPPSGQPAERAGVT